MSDEIEWGEWGPRQNFLGDNMQRTVGGVVEWCYPVKRKPVVETVTLVGSNIKGWGWCFDIVAEIYTPTHSLTLTIIDGVVQPTATVEML